MMDRKGKGETIGKNSRYRFKFRSIDTYLNVILEIEDETTRLVRQLFPLDDGRVDIVVQHCDLVAIILSL